MQADPVSLPGVAQAADAVARFSRRNWRVMVIAMLLLLHVAAVRGVSDDWARALLLAHLGLLLLWQPFLRGQDRVTLSQAALIAGAAVAVMLWLSWWLLAFWVVTLSGFIAGKVYQQHARWQRRFYLVVLVYLVALLAVIILPEIAPRREITAEVRAMFEYGLPLLLLAAVLFPTEPDSADAPQVIDFFYSLFVMFVLSIVTLGSFTFMTLGRMAYLPALTYTVFLIAAMVFVIGLAWDPRAGFTGLSVFFSRYLFSIGLPIEKWLYFLAELSQIEARPERFLAEAVAGLARLQWVAGATWRGAHGGGEAGEKSPYAVEFNNRDLSLTIYSRYRTGPALHWHLHVLGQLLAEFYVGKLREQKLQEQSYLKAVHETGARMTHDVKNLLQSLNVLCAVAAREQDGNSPELQALVRRQLPAVAQRLGETLEKLERPQADSEKPAEVQPWWDALVRQYRDHGVEFAARGLRAGLQVPRTLFGSVADNLLQNALAKRREDGSVQVRVALDCGAGRVELRVCDSGHAVPPEVAPKLFQAPVDSRTGLGIGLYQAARQAQAAGFELVLTSNRDGQVCFALAGPTGEP
ncbi:MAG: sensor histidine kinase [Sphingomonadaceae bacterium]